MKPFSKIFIKIFIGDKSIMARCDCGNCTVKCPGACYCISDANDPRQIIISSGLTLKS
jgi:hypothetical protein